MDKAKWNKMFSVGIEQIDSRNFHFFKLLHNAYRSTAKRDHMPPSRFDLEQIVHCGEFHFAREELWMAHTQYPLLSPHEEEHKQLRNNLVDVCAAVQHDIASARHSWQLLIERLLLHIKTSDAAYGRSESATRLPAYLKSKKNLLK
jgi:hemerythrin-like metal-binding protein